VFDLVVVAAAAVAVLVVGRKSDEVDYIAIEDGNGVLRGLTIRARKDVADLRIGRLLLVSSAFTVEQTK
jgi:hypothetical protein